MNKENASAPPRVDYQLISFVEREASASPYPYLPEEIIHNILCFLPADILHNIMIFVCSQWNSIIHDSKFITAHLHHHWPSTLVYTNTTNLDFKHYKFLHLKGGGEFVIESVCNELDFIQPPAGIPSPSCNGLVLMIDKRIKKQWGVYCNCIVNPVLNRILKLPHVSEDDDIIVLNCALAFAPSSNVYKVIKLSYHYDLFEHKVQILTVNVDRDWRLMNTSFDITEFLGYFGHRAAGGSGGYLYFGIDVDGRFGNRLSILKLDVEREVFSYFSAPEVSNMKRYNSHIVPWENTISFCKVNTNLSIDVWVLKDQRSEEWVKYDSHFVKSEVPIRELKKIYNTSFVLHELSVKPHCWLNSNLILFLTHSRDTFFIYDVKTGLSFLYTVDGVNSFPMLFPHVNSLAWV